MSWLCLCLMPTVSVQVFVFTALLTYLLYPPADTLPREFYCYRMCRNALNKCMEKSCKGKFPALVPVECLAKHTDCNEKCGFMSTMLKYHLDSEKPPVRLRLVEWLCHQHVTASLNMIAVSLTGGGHCFSDNCLGWFSCFTIRCFRPCPVNLSVHNRENVMLCSGE